MKRRRGGLFAVRTVGEKFAVEGSLREWNAAYAAWCHAINYCSKNVEGFDLEEFIDSEDVQAVTIEHILSNYLPRDDKKMVILLDIQGSELEALKGIDLNKHPEIIALIVEVSKRPIYIGGANYQEIHRHLKKYDYGLAFGFVNPPTFHGEELFLPISNKSELRINYKIKLTRYLIALMLHYYLFKKNTLNFKNDLDSVLIKTIAKEAHVIPSRPIWFGCHTCKKRRKIY